MSPKIFSEDDRLELKDRMLEAGMSFLREYGMTHMSVEKIAEAAGIGKGTFYHFFPSKEEFVCELIAHQRAKYQAFLAERLQSRGRLSRAEAEEMFRLIIFSPDSAYQYLTPEDIVRIRAKVPQAVTPVLEEETVLLRELFSHMEGVREDPDYAVIANLLKVMALTAESRDQLHPSAYERTQDRLFGLLFSLIFA